MSDKMTEVSTPTGGLGLLGYVPHGEAVKQLRDFYEREAKQATDVLADIDAGRVRVFHQLGPYAMKNRREVNPKDET